jgi:hypothetical protein
LAHFRRRKWWRRPPIDPRLVRDVLGDCRRHGVAVFHKQWGTYASNPLVVEDGLEVAAAKVLDSYGKGGGLLDGELVREFPQRRGDVAEAA